MVLRPCPLPQSSRFLGRRNYYSKDHSPFLIAVMIHQTRELRMPCFLATVLWSNKIASIPKIFSKHFYVLCALWYEWLPFCFYSWVNTYHLRLISKAFSFLKALLFFSFHVLLFNKYLPHCYTNKSAHVPSTQALKCRNYSSSTETSTIHTCWLNDSQKAWRDVTFRKFLFE